MQALLIWFERLPVRQLGCYGNTETTTPGFDQLAAQSVTFDNCFSTDVLEETASDALLQAVRTIFERHAAIHVLEDRGTMLGQGLEAITGRLAIRAPADADDRVRQMIEALASTAPADSLILVSLPGPATGPQLVEADSFIGTLTTAWADVCDDQSLLVMTAARGESPCEDVSHTDHANHILPHSGLGEQQTHVPLLICPGRGLDYGARCQALVSTLDVVATLTDGFGIAVPHSESGRPLGRFLTDDRSEFRDALILRGRQGAWAIRTHDWSLITRLDDDCTGDTWTARMAESAVLFAKPDDTWDHLDVARQWPDVVEQLVERLRTSLEEPRSTPSNPQSP